MSFSNHICISFLNKKISSFYSGTKLVEPSPALQNELNSELEKATKQYGGAAGVDMTKFPTFKFSEPKLDPISIEKK